MPLPARTTRPASTRPTRPARMDAPRGLRRRVRHGGSSTSPQRSREARADLSAWSRERFWGPKKDQIERTQADACGRFEGPIFRGKPREAPFFRAGRFTPYTASKAAASPVLLSNYRWFDAGSIRVAPMSHAGAEGPAGREVPMLPVWQEEPATCGEERVWSWWRPRHCAARHKRPSRSNSAIEAARAP